MLIDWFTVAAQALNFLILVWLMRRYLFRPILHAIDAREKQIAAALADADAKKSEAQHERVELERKNEQFDQERAALLGTATDNAKVVRRRLLDEAQQATAAFIAKRQEALRDDARNLSRALGRRAQQEVFAVARKALTDLATTSLESQMGEVFIWRLRQVAGPAKALLVDAFKTTATPALVRSAFDLPRQQRAAIQDAIKETFSSEVTVRFETTPDLISGIELITNGQRVAWSIADYLASLEKHVTALLSTKPTPSIGAEPSTEERVNEHV